MARPLPVNLLLAGTGAVLLVSGFGGESLGEVLKGSFGNLKPQSGTAGVADTTGEGVAQNVAETSGSQGSTTGEIAPGNLHPAASSPGSSTFAASPDVFRRHVSKAAEAKAIASILLARHITNPTHQQIEEARAFYHKK